MPRHQTIPIVSRQNIRIEIAERRGVTIAEVPYPTSNISYYQYSLELDYISREYYELITEIEMIRQRTRDQARITRETRNFLNRRNLSHQQMLGIIEEGYGSIIRNLATEYVTNLTGTQVTSIISRGFTLMNDRIDEAVGIVRGHPMEGIEVTHERIMERHGERLADTNNSLCRECLIPIELGEDLCEDCHTEIEIIPRWIMS